MPNISTSGNANNDEVIVGDGTSTADELIPAMGLDNELHEETDIENNEYLWGLPISGFIEDDMTFAYRAVPNLPDLPEISGSSVVTTTSDIQTCPNGETLQDNHVWCEIEQVQEHVLDVVDTHRGYVTENYRQDNMYYCDRCENDIFADSWDSDHEVCEDCAERYRSERRDGNECDVNSTEFFTDEAGDTIKSLRKFGVEIECLADDDSDIDKVAEQMSKAYAFADDGSIDGAGYAVEIVTPILQGKLGEAEILKVGEALSNNFFVNETTGLHVHLDCTELKERHEFRYSNDRDSLHTLYCGYYEDGYPIMLVSKKLLEFGMSDDTTEKEVMQKFFDFCSVAFFNQRVSNMTKMGFVHQFISGDKESMICLRAERTIDGNYPCYFIDLVESTPLAGKLKALGNTLMPDGEFVLNYENASHILLNNMTKEDILEALFVDGQTIKDWIYEDKLIVGWNSLIKRNNTKIQQLYDVYTSISSVIESMIPHTRRNTHYCKNVMDIPLTNGFTFEERFYGEKLRGKPKKYDERRYYGVNFHSLFYRGTLEIRYHSGTLNPVKILNWVKLHQSIVDFTLNQGQSVVANFINDMKRVYSLGRKFEIMQRYIGLEADTVEYVTKRIKKFEGDDMTFTKRIRKTED